MLRQCLFTAIVSVSLVANVAGAAEENGDKVLDRFVGTWRSEITRKGPESPEGQKLTSEEVNAKSLKGRYLIGRELNPKSNVKFIWLMTYDPQAKNYAWTYFNTQGLLGTEWRGTWDEATSTLTSKSSDAPATWTSSAVNRFVDKDKVEANAWMKNDQGKPIFEMTVTKARQPDAGAEKTLAAWRADPEPKAELTPELKVLDQLAGTWDVTATMKKAEWTPEDSTTKSKVVRTWILNRMFLQDTSTSDDGTESISLTTYDPKQSQYRSWWFNSAGYSSKSTGQRDAASNSIEWKSTLPEGQTATSSVRIIDKDQHEWKILITDAAGKVYMDAVWKCVRAKP